MASTPKPAWARGAAGREHSRDGVGKDHLWPIDDTWNFTPAAERSKISHGLHDALERPLWKADGVDDYALKAQLHDLRGRARHVRGLQPQQIHLHRCHPVDAEQRVAFDDLAPVRLLSAPRRRLLRRQEVNGIPTSVYGYDDHSIWLVSSQYVDAKGLKLTTKVLNLDMSEKFSQQTTLDAAADSTNKVLTLPEIDGLSPRTFSSCA